MSKADDHGKVAALAEDLLGSVQWSDAIEAADSPRIFPVGKILRIQLKLNTALLSHCPSVRVLVTGVTSHIYRIYKGINAMLIIREPIKPYKF